MREADRITIEEIGIPAIVLMENAGRQVAAAMEASFDDLAECRVAILAGRGNNGGDGFVVARTLVQHGIDTSVFLIGRVEEVRGDARTNLEILGHLGMTVIEIPDEQEWELHLSDIKSFDILVDALFGTGLRQALTGLFQTVVGDINASGLRVVSIDLPSGLSADKADLVGDTVQATLTVTLGAPKIPLVLPPGEFVCGDVVIADIGIPFGVFDRLEGQHLEVLTRDAMHALLPPRSPEGHKGDYGRVLVVAGSVGKTGAAHLSGYAALKSGAGLSTIATPRACLPVVAALAPEYMTIPLMDEETEAGGEAALRQVLEASADVIAVGPGLGTGPWQQALVWGLLERSGAPLVLDADALNVCATDPARLVARDGLDVVITPHPGEMARLVGTTVEMVEANRIDVALEFARTHHVHVILKGHRTIIATPDGRASISMTGNPGMATGGTGDVLTGMVAAWSAQLLDMEAACRLAVYLHGLAGDLAEADEGAVGMTAGDLLAHVGDAVVELSAERSTRDADA